MELHALFDVPDVVVVYRDRNVGGSTSQPSISGRVKGQRVSGSVTRSRTGGTINQQPTLDGKVEDQ